MSQTLFERIIAREIPARIEHEDERCIVIHDIEPQAPVHLLIIPKRVIARVGDSQPGDEHDLGHLIVVAGEVARKLGLSNGFRLVINSGPDACEASPTSTCTCSAGGRWRGRPAEETYRYQRASQTRASAYQARLSSPRSSQWFSSWKTRRRLGIWRRWR